MRFRLPTFALPCLFLFAFCADLPSDATLARHKTPKVCRNDGYVVTLAVHDTTLSQVGDTAAVTATVTHCAGVIAPNVIMSYTTRDASVATVNSTTSLTFTVTAVAGGSTYIVATSDGGGADSIGVLVSACTPTATLICPGDNCATKVSAQASGTAFTFSAGTFRFCTFTAKSNDTFTGAASHASILDGGRVLTGWTVSGSNWYVGGQTQQGTVTGSGTCQAISLGDVADYPRCQYPEQLWMDGTIKKHVATLATCIAGTWFFDYTADRIYVGDDPNGRSVVTSVSSTGIVKGTATGVTVDGLVVQHYAIGNFNSGAIDAGTGWTVKNTWVLDNTHKGVRVMDENNVTFQDNKMSRNGQLGFSASESTGLAYITGLAVTRVHMDSNNTAGWRRQFSAGAMKITRSSGLSFVGNMAYRNQGNGLWWDLDNLNAVITSDSASFNDGTGIFYEISWGCTITSPVVVSNGQNPTDALQNGAGIVVSASPDCVVSGGTVTSNAHAIIALQQDRGSGDLGVHLIKNLDVHNNTVVATTGDIGYKGSFDATNVATAYNNHWENNHYTLQGAGNYFNVASSGVTDNVWQNTYGNDDVAGGGSITRN